MTRRTIGRAAVVVSAGILLSRVLGFGRNVLLYALLGRAVATDLYVDAFTIPDYLFFLMAGGYLSITLVPILTEHHARGDDREARRSFTAVFRAVATALVGLTVLLIVFARPLTQAVFPRVEDVARLTSLTRIALASQVFFGMGTLLMAAQYARRRFLIPTLAPLIYNLGIIGGGLVGALGGHPSPEAFLWGGLVGAATGNFALQAWGAKRTGMTLVRGVPWRHPAVGEYLAMALPLMVGQSVVALDEQWPRLFGQLVGPGGTAGLYGARQLNMLPVGVIAQAAGVAAYPFLARLAAEGRDGDLRQTVVRSARGTVVIAGAAAAVVVALAAPIVRTAYQWGSFGAADTEAVAPLLALYGLSIPFWAAHQVYTRAFYARRRMWVPVVIGTAVTVVSVPVFVVAALRFGAAGVALTSSASVAVYTVAIAVGWHRAEPGPRLGGALGKTAAVTVVAGAAAWATARGLRGLGVAATSPLVLVVGTVVAFAVYLAGARAVTLPLPTRTQGEEVSGSG